MCAAEALSRACRLGVIHVAVIHRRAVIHVRSAPDSDRFLCEARNDAMGQDRA